MNKTVSEELSKMKKEYQRYKNLGNLLVEQDKVIQNFWTATVIFSLSHSNLHAWYLKLKVIFFFLFF